MALKPSIGAAEPRTTDVPDGFAVKTFVCFGIFLDTDSATGGASAAAVQPIAVGIQAVLDVLWVDFDVILPGQAAGAVPGGNF